jgi:hypothetical protein
LVVAVALLLAACETDSSAGGLTTSPATSASSSSQPGGTTTVGETTTSAVDGAPTSASPDSSTTEPPDDNSKIDYPQWGPDDPLIPGQYGALAATAGQPPDCDAVEEQKPSDDDFWAAVVAVCRAITGQGDWPARVPPPPEAPNGFQDCLNGELQVMLTDALDWHDSHPGATPKVVYPKRSAHSACILHIYEANVFPANTENHPEGGVVVEMQVPGLNGNENPPVRIDGMEVPIDQDFGGPGDGLSNGEVFLAAPIDEHQATLEIDTPIGTLTTKIDLPRVDTASTGSSGTDTTVDTEVTTSSSTGESQTSGLTLTTAP